MSILARFNGGYLNKLSERQRDFSETSAGVKFINDFVFKKGNHLFIVGNTGSGKTQKGYWVMDWLKHTENQIWISTAKSNEIRPLFCQGKKIRVIIPVGSEFSIEEHRKDGWGALENPPEVVQVATASEAWDAASVTFPDGHHKAYEYINIFEFRDTITQKEGIRSKWMIGLFESLASRTRSGTMANIFPCTIYLDEAQWLLAGSRITKLGSRVRDGAIVIENVLEMRSAGCRFVMFAQSYKNIPPAIRDNMLVTILCRGAKIPNEENDALAYHCRLRPGPTHYQPHKGKFVHADGTAYPAITPWEFPLYPLERDDRDWIGRIRINYGRKYGEYSEKEEIQQECFPELGRFSVLAIKPELQEMVESRWNIPSGEVEDD
jgi:energy-coupling factor transporter ATP-binding protein EcfA2